MARRPVPASKMIEEKCQRRRRNLGEEGGERESREVKRRQESKKRKGPVG